jgi:hypothetical protein
MQEADRIAGGAADALVQCVVDAAVGLADEAGEPAAMRLDDRLRAVGRAAVDDPVLDVRVRLRGDRAQAVGQGSAGVVGGGDDADLQPWPDFRNGYRVGGLGQSAPPSGCSNACRGYAGLRISR